MTRQLRLDWDWASYHYDSEKRKIEWKLHNLKSNSRDKSQISGAQFEYDVWVCCEPLAKQASIEMRWQFRINGGEHIADIFLRRVRYYGGLDVILSIKDQTGNGSHDKKITDDLAFAKRNGIPIEFVVCGDNISTSVRNSLADKKKKVIYFDDFPNWVNKITETQLLPEDEGVQIRSRIK
jgi:hypothetical protein